jgi:phenylpyruvate tautomerase PptA (4-oxalocrotonate tautomerase family)
MPVVEVEIVVSEGEELEPGLAVWLSEAAGQVLQAPPGDTWVRLRTLDRETYAESGGGPPEGVRPVFVRVLSARLPGGELLAVQAARLTEVVGELCQRPARNVHVIFEPPAEGRVAFGGELVE